MQDKFYLQAMKWLYQKNPRYARAVHWRVQYEMTFNEMAEEFGVSVERARQLFIRGASLLQKHVKKEYV